MAEAIDFKIQRPTELNGACKVSALVDGDVGYMHAGYMNWTGKKFYTATTKLVIGKSEGFDVRVWKQDGITYFCCTPDQLKFFQRIKLPKKEFLPENFHWKEIIYKPCEPATNVTDQKPKQ